MTEPLRTRWQPKPAWEVPEGERKNWIAVSTMARRLEVPEHHLRVWLQHMGSVLGVAPRRVRWGDYHRTRQGWTAYPAVTLERIKNLRGYTTPVLPREVDWLTRYLIDKEEHERVVEHQRPKNPRSSGRPAG